MTLPYQPHELGFDTTRLNRLQSWMHGYVESGKLAGASCLVARHGEIAWYGEAGLRDEDANSRWSRDTVVRIYSMTKPVTAVALMMLYEQALCHLDDPVSVFLPEFADRFVLVEGAKSLDEVEHAKTEITLRHLLTHTAGLSYFFNDDLVSTASNEQKIWFDPIAGGLESQITKMLALPLLFQPGERWNYSPATDVIGRVVEVISGQKLDEFFAQHIFGPLRMSDTGFHLQNGQQERFAACYMANENGQRVLMEAPSNSKFEPDRVDTLSGGGGLVGTIDDYYRFAQMLASGGELDGEQILGPRTIDLMRANHLPGEIAAMGPKTWAETSFEGVGYTLAGSVMLDPARAQMSGSPGDYGWGGMASTTHWIDPVEDMVVVYFTQFVPSSHYPLRKQLRALVYQALVD